MTVLLSVAHPLLFYSETPSRPLTPAGGASSNGAAAPTAADVAVADNSRAKGSKFEERVAALADVDVDLDF